MRRHLAGFYSAVDRNNLQERVAKLTGRLDELSTQRQKPTRKNVVDVLSSFSPLISGVLVAAVGAAATWFYNERQMQISHLDAVDKYRKYTMSTNPVDRDYGYEALIRLGEWRFVVRLIAQNKDDAGLIVLARFKELVPEQALVPERQFEYRAYLDTAQIAENTVEKIMATAKSSEQQAIPELKAATTDTGTEGWAYVGHYVASAKEWKTHYFNLPEGATPLDLEGEHLEVRQETGSLNVRASMPSQTGEFGKIIGVLKPGSSTKLSDIQKWRSTDYVWAKVTYGT